MAAMAIRGLAVVAIATAIVVAVFAIRDRGNVPPTLLDANLEPIEDSAGFTPVPGFNNDGSAPHELVRYDLPEPSTTPPLSAGAEALSFEALWAPGDFALDIAPQDRLGLPSAAVFEEEGLTEEDRAAFFLDMTDMRSMQPITGRVREELDGKRVRLAGFVAPVGFEAEERHFLLVPELGACVHVPPPPPNQIVYVDSKEVAPPIGDTVWVTGTLRAEPVATILADVGYRLEDIAVEPYQ